MPDYTFEVTLTDNLSLEIKVDEAVTRSREDQEGREALVTFARRVEAGEDRDMLIDETWPELMAIVGIDT